MSRTTRRKNQDTQRFGLLYYSRAFGHESDTDWIEGKTGEYLGYVQASKERVFRSMYYAHGDGRRYGTIGTRMPVYARKSEEHKHRARERAKIVNFMKGARDDVVPAPLRRFPKHYW